MHDANGEVGYLAELRLTQETSDLCCFDLSTFVSSPFSLWIALQDNLQDFDTQLGDVYFRTFAVVDFM